MAAEVAVQVVAADKDKAAAVVVQGKVVDKVKAAVVVPVKEVDKVKAAVVVPVKEVDKVKAGEVWDAVDAPLAPAVNAYAPTAARLPHISKVYLVLK